MVPAAVLIAVGVALHTPTPGSPVIWVGVGATAAGVGWIARHRRGLCGAALAVAALAIGLTAGGLGTEWFPADEIARFTTDHTRLAEIELAIGHPPRVLVVPGDVTTAPPRQVALATARAVGTWDDGWVPASGPVLLQVHEPHPTLRAGHVVRALGYLQRPAPAMNPGQFDWAAYYREQRILASFTVPQAGNITVVGDEGAGVVGWLRAKVRGLLARGFGAADSLDHALLRALLLGDADPELRDVQDQFRATGTSHHLSISGLHVAVLGGFVYLGCRALRVRPRAGALVMAGFVVLYGVVALPSPPVVRSVLLCLAFTVGVTTRRGVDGPQLLCLCAAAMLVYHPADLYNAGFQLSFGTVAGLMLFTRPVRAWLVGRRDLDVRLAPRRPGVVPAVAGWADSQLMTVLAAGVVAWVVSMPLVAYHFGQVNPWAVPAGILLAPVVFAALILGFLKVVLTLLLPSLAAAWAWAAAVPVRAMRGVLDGLSLLPKSDVPLPAPPVWLVLAFYAALLLMLVPWRRDAARWAARGAAAVALGAMLVLPFVSPILRPGTAGGLRVTLLHVGAGQCAVIEPPGGRVVVADAGSFSLADPLRKAIAPYLRHRGITAVDTLVLSHGDLDHFSAAGRIVAGYGVREVLVGHRFAGGAAENPAAVALLRAFDALDRPPRVLAPGDVIPLARDTRVEVLWPPPDVNLPDNDCSVVFKLTHAGTGILFTGDIQEAATRALLRDPAKLKADVLIAPHHGSAERSTRALVDAVDPRLVVSSNDRSLTQKQQQFDRVAGDRRLLRTHLTGAVTINVSNTGELTVETTLGPPTGR